MNTARRWWPPTPGPTTRTRPLSRNVFIWANAGARSYPARTSTARCWLRRSSTRWIRSLSAPSSSRRNRMAKYVIEELARYTVEAGSVQDAIDIFLSEMPNGPHIVNCEVPQRDIIDGPAGWKDEEWQDD